ALTEKFAFVLGFKALACLLGMSTDNLNLSSRESLNKACLSPPTKAPEETNLSVIIPLKGALISLYFDKCSAAETSAFTALQAALSAIKRERASSTSIVETAPSTSAAFSKYL